MKKLLSILAAAIIAASCTSHKEFFTQEIRQNWVFKKASDKTWLPATVPGCVHTDLLDNKVIKDPFYRLREDSVQWIENEDWEYQATFGVCGCIMDMENMELVFEGLDTYADVYLNDSLVLKADNMFIEHRISCKKGIKAGENKLRVYLHSPVTEQMKKLRTYGYLPKSANERMPDSLRTRVFTRKAPFHYGWDWGPRLVTSGIWRPVKLVAWNSARIDDMYLKPQKIDSSKADYIAQITVVAQEEVSASFEVKIDNTGEETYFSQNLKEGINEISIPISIEKPELWWPNGLGSHMLYTVKANMKIGHSVVHEISRTLGVRTIELVRQPDTIGTSFFFKVNGIPVFMKGADYIPNDIFTTRVSDKINKRLINDAVISNMNMFRLWGGAIYELSLIHI